MIGCGGCAGMGAHVRWCPEEVGPVASRLGEMSDRAEALAEDMAALDSAVLERSHANRMYGLADLLYRKASLAAEQKEE